ncbi:MAG: ankyrin repeat domain-containing protein [Ramlibacter sp.]|nr:ankyrin repeat domain-containing protein [Ramlibacter sp.]
MELFVGLKRFLFSSIVVGLNFSSISMAQQHSQSRWSGEEINALYTAAQHTAGQNQFEYRLGVYKSRNQAELSHQSGVWTGYPVLKASNLVEVPPHLRQAMSELYKSGDRSRIIDNRARSAYGEEQWLVVELVGRRKSVGIPKDEVSFREWAARMVDIGNLPSPSFLMNDLVARAQAGFWRATTVHGVTSLPTDLDPNVRFGQGSTPLTLAVGAGDIDVVRALLARNANPNICEISGCPLTIATLYASENESLFDELIARGAQVDQVDLNFSESTDTLLTKALFLGNTRLATKLLDLGASVNGVPGGNSTPLLAALTNGDKSFAELLLSKGASPLPFHDRALAPSPVDALHLYHAATAANNPQLVPWVEQTMLHAAGSSPEYKFSLAVEQNSRKFAVKNNSTISVKAAPFRIVLQFSDQLRGRVRIGGSLSPRWMQELVRGDNTNAMFDRLSAMTPRRASDDDSRVLLLSESCQASSKAGDRCAGVHVSLRSSAGGAGDFHEFRPASGEHVLEIQKVGSVLDFAESAATPLSKMKGKSLYMAVATVLDLRANSGSRLISPYFFQLKFD